MATRRRRYIDGDVEDEIRRLARVDWGASQIERELDKRGSTYKGRLPSLRSIQRIVKQETREPGDPWSFVDTDAHTSDPVSARHILDVLAYVFEASAHRIIQITQQEAEWIVRLRSAYPEMPAEDVWMFTQRYIGALQDEWPTTPESQDLLLGHRVWSETATENSPINLDLNMETAVRWAKQRQHKRKGEE